MPSGFLYRTIERNTNPTAVLYSGTKIPIADDIFVTQPGIEKSKTPTFDWEGITYNWIGKRKYTFLPGQPPIIEELVEGQVFQLKDSNIKYRVDKAYLTAIEGLDLFINEIIDGQGETAPDTLEEGHAFIKNVRSGGSWYLLKKVNGQIQELPLMEGSHFLLDGRLQVFNGVSVEAIDRPFEVRICVTKNLDLDNLTQASFRDACDRVNQGLFQSNAVTVALVAQTDRKQNGLYRISVVPGQTATYQRMPPIESGAVLVNNLNYFVAALGDVWSGRVFTFKKYNTPLNPTPAQNRFTVDTDDLEVEILTPSQKDLNKVSESLSKNITDLSDKTAADLKKVSDAIAAYKIEDLKTFADDTAADVKKATDAIAELKKAMDAMPPSGATPEQIADLEAKIKAVEDSLKKANEAIVAAEESTEIDEIKKALAPKVPIYTLDTTITVKVGDEIRVDKEGDIQFPDDPPDGAEIKLFDELAKIKKGKNNILLGRNDRFLKLDETFSDTPLEFDEDNQLRAGWARFKYTLATRSWKPFVGYSTPPTESAIGTGGDRIELVVLTTLPPETWTPFPSASKTIKGFEILDTTGALITNYLDTRKTTTGWEVFSLVVQNNLTFQYEIGD